MVQPNRITNKSFSKILPLILAFVANGFFGNLIEANPINAANLSLSLTMGMAQQVQVSPREQQMSKVMEQIMSDQFENDFKLSISLLNHFSDSMEAFIKAEHLEGALNDGSGVLSKWAATNNCNPNQPITKGLDLVVATFWSQFKPLVMKIIGERPPDLGANDLDFRCTRRTAELGTLMQLGARSSLYSIYLDTFLSEFYVHCLFRKLALIRNKGIVPTPLVRQFVDIYLNLPTMDPMKANSREAQESAINQLLAGRALSFNLQAALAQIGPLNTAARLVADPRTFLSSTPAAIQVDQLVQEFERDCKRHILQLNSVWTDDFDRFIRALGTQTTNLEDLNTKVRFVAPQLAYGTICGQLMQLPH